MIFFRNILLQYLFIQGLAVVRLEQFVVVGLTELVDMLRKFGLNVQ
jgi:hypothetical protein